MSISESLVKAMHLPPDSDTVGWLHEHGLAIADQDTMSKAIHDVYCGLRGFTKDAYRRMNLRMPGMELASEIVIKSAKAGLRIEGGTADGDLLAGMERGLWVRRLHYVNGFIDTRRAVMTGLTRDGCHRRSD